MGKDSAILWTDHTFNPWWGCVKVSPGCDNCYAETWARRKGHDVWGKDAPRRTGPGRRPGRAIRGPLCPDQRAARRTIHSPRSRSGPPVDRRPLRDHAGHRGGGADDRRRRRPDRHSCRYSAGNGVQAVAAGDAAVAAAGSWRPAGGGRSGGAGAPRRCCRRGNAVVRSSNGRVARRGEAEPTKTLIRVQGLFRPEQRRHPTGSWWTESDPGRYADT